MARVAHSSYLALLETIAKSPTMANGQSMLRAQAGAAANENLDATPPGREKGLGSRGLVPGSSSSWFLWRLLNPSQQVHNTWAEGLETGGGQPQPTEFLMECPSRGVRELRYR